MPFAPPMLAGKIKTADLSRVQFPVLGQPKLDGNRALIQGGVALSRKGLPFVNVALQAWVAHHAEALEGLDGELIVGDPAAADACRRTSSVVNSRDKTDRVDFYVYDCWDRPHSSYRRRLLRLHTAPITLDVPHLHLVATERLASIEELNAYEARMLNAGYEGVILRSPDAFYKYGRSTLSKGELLALKRFEDTEAEVIGYAEEMQNNNEQVRDAVGNAKRSTHKANKTGKGLLGALRCRGLAGTPFAGLEFDIGSGFTDALAAELWAEKDSLAGRFVTFQYFASGVKELPRFPVFKCFRDAIDMGEVA